MGKPKYLPQGKALERSIDRAAEAGNFLLESRSRGDYPFGGKHDPSAMLLVAPKLFGVDLTSEDAAWLTLFWSMVDRGIDSLIFGSRIAHDIIDNGGLNDAIRWTRGVPEVSPWQNGFDDREIDPFDDNYDQYEPFVPQELPPEPIYHYDVVADYLSGCNHPFAGQVASHWVHTHDRIVKQYDGSVLTALKGDSQQVYKRLRDEFLGLGPKTTPLFMARMYRSGLARHLDLAPIGIAVDRHVLAQTLGMNLLPDIQGPVNADAAINASIWLWRMVCSQRALDPAALHETLWLQGRMRCRQVDCANCPLWRTACQGRVSLALYNGEGRKIDPRVILTPKQLELDFGAEIEPGPPAGPYNHITALFLGSTQLQLPLSSFT